MSYFHNASKSSLDNSNEKQEKFLQERISSTEKHFGNMCSAFGKYSHKTADLRDKSDEFALALNSYAEAEDINESLRSSLIQFSCTLGVIGDYRDTRVRRLEETVVNELSKYKEKCKKAKGDLKDTISARDAEVMSKLYLSRLKDSHPRFIRQISQAESELSKATAEVTKSERFLFEHMDIFEKNKLNDVRRVLLDFTRIELSFHAKAVELFTKAYQEVSQINEHEDVSEFRIALKCLEPVSRFHVFEKSVGNSFSLTKLLPSISWFKKTSSGLKHSRSMPIQIVSDKSNDALIREMKRTPLEMQEEMSSDPSL